MEKVVMDNRDIGDLYALTGTAISDALDKGENMDAMDEVLLEPDCIAKCNGQWGVIQPNTGFVAAPTLTLEREIQRNPQDALRNRKGRISHLSRQLKNCSDPEKMEELSQGIEAARGELAKIRAYIYAHTPQSVPPRK